MELLYLGSNRMLSIVSPTKNNVYFIIGFENQVLKQITSRIKLFTLIGSYWRIAQVEIPLVEFITKFSFAQDLSSLSFFNAILNHCCYEGKSKLDPAFHASISCVAFGPLIVSPPVRVDFHLYLSFTPYTLHVINQLKCYLKIKVAKKVKIAIGRWYNSHFGPE